MTDTTTPVRPPSLRALVEAGVDPAPAMACWSKTEPDERLGYELGEAVWLGGGDLATVRLQADWMIENQDVGMGPGMTNLETPEGRDAFLRITTGWLWRAEILEDPTLIERALALSTDVARASFAKEYAEWQQAMSEPNPDGLDAWDLLTVDERRAVEAFVVELIANRGGS